MPRHARVITGEEGDHGRRLKFIYSSFPEHPSCLKFLQAVQLRQRLTFGLWVVLFMLLHSHGVHVTEQLWRRTAAESCSRDHSEIHYLSFLVIVYGYLNDCFVIDCLVCLLLLFLFKFYNNKQQ